jgi:hypothetical protein
VNITIKYLPKIENDNKFSIIGLFKENIDIFEKSEYGNKSLDKAIILDSVLVFKNGKLVGSKE